MVYLETHGSGGSILNSLVRLADSLAVALGEYISNVEKEKAELQTKYDSLRLEYNTAADQRNGLQRACDGKDKIIHRLQKQINGEIE